MLYRLRELNALTVTPDYLLDWGRQYLSHYFGKPPSRMHRALGRELLTIKRGTRLNVLAPRKAAKSTIASTTFTLYSAVTGREPYIVLIAETDRKAKADLKKIATELESNKELAQAYPEACGRSAVWSQHEIELRNGVVIQAYSSGSEDIRGIKHGALRPTLVIGDDLQGDKHIYSEIERQRTLDWFNRAVLNLGTTETIYVNLGTAIHREGLVNLLLDNPTWESLIFKSIEQWPDRMQLWNRWEDIHFDWSIPTGRQRSEAARAFYIENESAMNAGAIIDWPEHESLYELMEKRLSIGSPAFEAEKQGNPVDPKMLEFPESYFDEHIWFEQWPHDSIFTVKAIGVDPSKGRKDKPSDYWANVWIGVTEDGMIYVEADLDRRPAAQGISDSVDLYLNFRPAIMGVESNVWQELLSEEMVREFIRRRTVQYWVQPIENFGNKAVRIRSLGAYLSRKQMRFKTGSPGTTELVRQLRNYHPNVEWDDGPDALEIAIHAAAMAQQSSQVAQIDSREEYIRI